MEPSDEDLMREYQAGNQEVLEILFLRYQKRIFNFSLRFLNNRADAEDATAEIFLNLMNHKRHYKPTARFSTWFFTVARNACISKIRKRQNIFSIFGKNKDSEGTSEPPHPITDRTTPRDELQTQELAVHVQKAVQTLPVSQKEVFLLRESHELSYAEISRITGHSLENVKVLIFRARETLRQNLGVLLKEAQP